MLKTVAQFGTSEVLKALEEYEEHLMKIDEALAEGALDKKPEKQKAIDKRVDQLDAKFDEIMKQFKKGEPPKKVVNYLKALFAFLNGHEYGKVFNGEITYGVVLLPSSGKSKWPEFAYQMDIDWKINKSEAQKLPDPSETSGGGSSGTGSPADPPPLPNQNSKKPQKPNPNETPAQRAVRIRRTQRSRPGNRRTAAGDLQLSIIYPLNVRKGKFIAQLSYRGKSISVPLDGNAGSSWGKLKGKLIIFMRNYLRKNKYSV